MAAPVEDLKAVGAAALSDFDKAVKEKAETKAAPTPQPAEIVIKNPGVEPTAADAVRIRQEKKARIAQVLSKGILGEKLKSIQQACTPDGYRSKFVRDKFEDIIRYQNLFFGFTYREGAGDGMGGVHATADGRIRVGDLVLMTIRIEDHEILQEVRTERTKNKLTQARREYHELSKQGDVAVIDESQTAIERGTIIDKR